MSRRAKILLGFSLYFGIVILLGVIFGGGTKNDAFKPQNEFFLDPWISLKVGGIDMSINKAVLYLALASGLTIFVMTYIARRMQREPNRIQMAMELAYDLTRNNIAGVNLDAERAARWFPFLASIFFFIWFSNMLGYLPLPTNTEHEISIFGLNVPALAIYAATANISIPLVGALVVTVIYHTEGIRAQGFAGYFKSWLPAGLEDMPAIGKVLIWLIEAISHFVRPISLSVRLFANILAGHLLILFMGGGLAVLLGLAALGALTFPMAFIFFVFEIGLVATLQAFIYIGGATAESH